MSTRENIRLIARTPCFKPAVSAGLFVYKFHCLVICCRGPQGRIVILANCVTLYKNCINK